jgi:PRTRC genetic system protein B
VDETQHTMALIFAGDQLLLRWEDERGETVCKFISPGAARSAFSLAPLDSGWLPDNVCRWGSGGKGDWLVTFAPPGRRSLSFVNWRVDAVDVPLPGLVFLTVGTSCYVWAVCGRSFDPHGQAFHAPLPNVDYGGRVCLGNNAVKDGAGSLDTFWRSPFSDHQVEGKSRRHGKDIRLQLLELVRSRARRYPTRDLVAMRETVGQLVERTIV